MKVLFLPAYGPEGASSRFRVYQFLGPLRAAGWTARVVTPPGPSRWSRTAHLVRGCLGALGADVVVLQKRLMGRGLGILSRANPRIIYDLDDAIHVQPPWAHVSTREMARLRSSLRRTASVAQVVTVGNRYLADYFTGVARQIAILPTTIDTELFRPSPRPRHRVAVVGWVGNPENLSYLEALNGVFATLAAQLPGRFVLRVVSGRPPERLPAAPCEFRPWSLQREVAEVQDFDIGIMPLADDEWSRGKCGFKAIQYMAVGAATVVSPVGVNREIVTDGVNGLWAGTQDAWFTTLRDLIIDGDARQRLAEAALDVVAEHYSLRSIVPALAALLRDVASRR